MIDSARSSPPSQWPHALTSFVGRGREIAALRDLLRRDDVRLLTLTGPGGVGKTRLALRVAEELAAIYADGVAFVSLAALSDPQLVAPTVGAALGLRDAGDLPIVERLVHRLRDADLLLILDNFEPVVAAAPLLADLLSRCPRLRVLATSRVRLRVSGEHEVVVAPLPLAPPAPAGSPDDVFNSEAGQLFIARARAFVPDLPLTSESLAAIAAICQRLDGLPLAIELAAARVKHLSLTALLARLERRLPLLTGGPRDAPARQRTMRDAIAWSYDLLLPPEQRLFRCLSVFVGGFDLEAAGAIAGDAPDCDLLDSVASLLDHSLLRQEAGPSGETRYAMLETIREFAGEQLEASGEAEACRSRHAAFFVDLAERAKTHVYSPTEAKGLARLAADRGNLRATLIWLEGRGEAESLLRFAIALEPFWLIRGPLREGQEWLERASALGEGVPTAGRARAAALVKAGNLALYSGDATAAEGLLELGLALARATGDAMTLAHALQLLGELAWHRGDLERNAALMAEALVKWRALGKLGGAAVVLQGLGDVAREQGDAALAVARYAEAAELARAIGNTVVTQWCEMGLALLALDQGNRAASGSHLATALRLNESAPGTPELEAIIYVAALGASSGQPEAAARLLGAAAAASEAVGLGRWPPLRRWEVAATVAARKSLGEDGFSAAWSAGRTMTSEAALREALVLAEALAATPAPAATRDAPFPLTAREQEVLRLIAAGHSNAEIAEALFITPRTASTHASHMLDKLGLSSRAELIAYAHTHGLV